MFYYVYLVCYHPRLIAIIEWRSNRRIEATPSLSRVTWTHPDAPSKIRRTRLNRVNLSIDAWSWPLIAMNRHIRRLRPKSLINWDVLRDGNVFLDFFSKSKCLDTTIWESFDFYSFLTYFRVRGVFEIRIWSKEYVEITYWTPSSSLKSRNEWSWIWKLIGSFWAWLWVRLRVFILIFHHLALELHFQS